MKYLLMFAATATVVQADSHSTLIFLRHKQTEQYGRPTQAW